MKVITSRIYLPQLLLFILAGEICDNYIYSVFSDVSNNLAFRGFSFYLFFLLLQIIFSPIQASFSDFYCRKKSLIISLSCSGLSVLPALFYFEYSMPLILLSSMALIKGILGNNLPLAWAGIADTQIENVRLSFALSTSAIAFGYLTLIVLGGLFTNVQLSIIIFLIFVILTSICLKKFVDIRDKENHLDHSENKSIWEGIKLVISVFFKSERLKKGLLTFLFWEISFYSAHMLDVDLKIRAFKGLTVSMILGYLTGVLCISQMARKTDEEMIKIGYIRSFAAFVPVFVLAPFLFDIKAIVIPCYFFYALGAAFLAPSMLSILSKAKEEHHDQGKIYGLLDSADTVAFLVSTIVAMTYNWFHLNKIFIIMMSFFMMVASGWPYAGFKKTIASSK